MEQMPRFYTIRMVIAFVIDVLLSFALFGWVIALVTGSTTEAGFSLEGLPALILFALVIAYFIIMNKFLGGTLGRRLLGVRPRS